MGKIYLDYNVYLDLIERGTDNFVPKLKEKGYEFYYSPAHIEEIARGFQCGMVSKEITDRNLQQVGFISDNKELFPYTYGNLDIIEKLYGDEGIVIIRESPFDCFKRVYSSIGSNVFAVHAQGQVLAEGHKKFSSYSDKQRVEELDRINKLNPIDDILEKEINKDNFIAKFISLWVQSDASMELNKLGMKLHPQTKAIQEEINKTAMFLMGTGFREYKKLAVSFLNPHDKCYDKIKYNFSLVENMVDLVLRELNRFGYKLEKMKKVESSLHDHTHVIYATACDYFVCRDNRLIGKAKAVYKYLGVNTTVINGNEREWWNKL